MKKLLLVVVAAVLVCGCASTATGPLPQDGPRLSSDVEQEHVALKPWTYFVDFEDRDWGAWASYPPWQDNAYDPNFRVNEMAPGDANISIEQKVTRYTLFLS